jgi:hypothetical protein
MDNILDELQSFQLSSRLSDKTSFTNFRKRLLELSDMIEPQSKSVELDTSRVDASSWSYTIVPLPAANYQAAVATRNARNDYAYPAIAAGAKEFSAIENLRPDGGLEIAVLLRRQGGNLVVGDSVTITVNCPGTHQIFVEHSTPDTYLGGVVDQNAATTDLDVGLQRVQNRIVFTVSPAAAQARSGLVIKILAVSSEAVPIVYAAGYIHNVTKDSADCLESAKTYYDYVKDTHGYLILDAFFEKLNALTVAGVALAAADRFDDERIFTESHWEQVANIAGLDDIDKLTKYRFMWKMWVKLLLRLYGSSCLAVMQSKRIDVSV